MRKIEKLVLRKIVEPTDILKKKQMKNLWGGLYCCSWYCTTDANGSPGHDVGSGNSWDDCWQAAERACTFPGYGIRIEGNC